MRAEDRFGWLDDEAAEDLLRGSAADGSSPCASPRAKELAGVLEALAESHQQADRTGELPGEAEALAAFRSARARDCRGGRAAGRSRRGRYMTRISGTPLHVGLAMALAGFALGGVAVAATSGVLPAPFGGGGSEDPGASGGHPPAVEPLESAGPPVDNTEGGEFDRPGGRHPGSVPWQPARPGAPEDERGTRDIAGADRGNGDGNVGGGSATPSPDRPSTWPHLPSPDPGGGSPDPGKWPPIPPSTQPDAPDPTVVVALCKAYEGDSIEQGKRRQLERVAGGPEQVERYCDEYGDGAGGGGGTEGGDGGDGGVGIPGDPDRPGAPQVPEDPDGSEGGSEGGGTGGPGGGGPEDGDGTGGTESDGAQGGTGDSEDQETDAGGSSGSAPEDGGPTV